MEFAKVASCTIFSTLVISLLSPEPAKAQKKLQMNRPVVVRKADPVSGRLDASGFLAPGAIVSIPKTFLERNGGESEAALMDWLKNSGELRSFSTPTGETKKDFFFPVEVTDPKGSRNVSAGVQVFVPIRFLAKMKGLSMVVEADPEASVRTVAPKTNATALNAVTKSPVKASQAPHLQSGIIFLPAIQKSLVSLDRKVERSLVNRKDTLSLARRYESTCPGKFEDFKREIVRVASEQKVPAEIIFSVMHMETGGRCNGIRGLASEKVSVGLFQINVNSTPVQRCNTWQMSVLRVARTMKHLREPSLKCLENPVANLEEAAQIMRSKYAAVNTRKQPEIERWDKGTADSHDDWRKALAAYNGGQSYVFQAYNDIISYNRKHGTMLNADCWETRRVFYFRRVLDRKTDQASFDGPLKYKRSIDNILINLAYVESIAGRETKPTESQVALVMQWVRTLYERVPIPFG